MRKRYELADPTSCLSKAADDEWLFVLRGKDAAASGPVGGRSLRGRCGLKRRRSSKGVEPVYLSRGQRIWLAGRLGLVIARLRECSGDPLASPELVRAAEDDIRRAASVRKRIREARIDG